MKNRMKILLALCLALCLLFPAGVLAFAAPEDGSWMLYNFAAPDETVILVPDMPSESESTAAETLCGYLEALTGHRPAVTSDTALPGVKLCLSVAERLTDLPKGSYELRAGLDADGQPLESPDDCFYIEGADARGLFNGVFAFLRNICGVEIYSADVKRIPDLSESIKTEYPYSCSYIPTLEYADTDWISPHDLDFSLANGLNGSYSPIGAVHGGKVNYLWFCHSLTNSIVPEGELMESHPEYFALTKNGKREATQLCLSNPEVVERAIRDVKNRLAEAYDPDAALNIVSVTQDDNQDYCVCENCTALAEQYGGQSGLMLWFVNQIADAVAPEYPDAVIDTFAYQYTRHAPTGIAPRENVCVRLCSIECCFSHALEDPACEANAEFMQDLKDWSKICNRLYVWDYVTNFSQTLGIFPDFGVLRENIDTFRRYNVVGIYEEGAYYGSQCNVGFFDLSAYMLSCLMRDELTAEEEKALRDGFLTEYYGGGDESIGLRMGELIDTFTEHAGDENGHLHIGQSMDSTFHGLDETDWINSVWDAMETRAAELGKDDALARIQRSRLAWRYYEACTQTGEFKNKLPGVPRFSENKKLISDLTAAGVTRYNEWGTMEQVKPSAYVLPQHWARDSNGAFIPAVIAALLTVLLAFFTAFVAFKKKHPVCGVLLIVLALLAVPLGIVSGQLFIEWENLPLYGFIDALMLLDVAGFIMIAAWAKNGFSFPKGKKLVLTVLAVLTLAALPYEVIVLLINTVINHSIKPTVSITLSAFCQILLIIASLIITLLNLRLGKKDAAPAEK